MAGRPYVTGDTRLELDGQDAGQLRSVEGGEPYAEVVEEAATSPGAVVGKHLGLVRYADIAIECSMTLSAGLANWIGATLGRSAPLHDGAIVQLDLDHKETSRLTFRNAFIREIEFPALDAAAKQGAHLKLRLAPESTRRQAGSGVPLATRDNTSHTSAKSQQASNFRLKVDGLVGTSVSKVEPLVVRQAVSESLAGDGSARLMPAGLHVPDLVAILHEAADWYAWRDSFIIDKKETERSGTLEYLAQDGNNVLSRIDFRGLGIHSLVAERTDQHTEGPRRVRASMYCENLSYVLSAVVSASTSGERITPQSRVEVITPLTSRRVFTSMESA